MFNPCNLCQLETEVVKTTMRFMTAQGEREIQIRHLIIAGWTGRDRAAVQHHIDELAEIGVSPPSDVPLFYRGSRNLLTIEEDIDVLGAHSSGEAEPLLIRENGRVWLGLGSDHTDRKLEAASVAASKQICAKPCAAELWDYESCLPHLDQIEIRSWIEENGSWGLYQEGTLAQILPLDQLLDAADLPDGGAMLCGTFPAIGGVRPSPGFRAEIRDPVQGRSISLKYSARYLPEVS